MNSLNVCIFLVVCCAIGQSMTHKDGRRKRQAPNPQTTGETAQATGTQTNTGSSASGTGTETNTGFVNYLLQAQNNVNTGTNNPPPQNTNNQVPQNTNNQIPTNTNNQGQQNMNYPGYQYYNYQGPQYNTNLQQQTMTPYQQFLNFWLYSNGIYFPPLQAGNGLITAMDGRDGSIATAGGTFNVDGADVSFSPLEW